MSGLRVLAIVLIVAGVLGVVYGGFTYTKNSEKTVIGPLELSVKETKNVPIPLWAGIGAVVAGGVLFVVRRKHS